MASPRRSYRARLAVLPLDPQAATMLSNAEHPDELAVVPLDRDTVEAIGASGADMLICLCTNTGAVDGAAVFQVTSDARKRGLLVAGAITGSVANPGGATEEERQGLADLREAVDMLVMVRDDALVMDLLDVLRGGRTGAPVPSES